jgi:hypothetical protein
MRSRSPIFLRVEASMANGERSCHKECKRGEEVLPTILCIRDSILGVYS